MTFKVPSKSTTKSSHTERNSEPEQLFSSSQSVSHKAQQLQLRLRQINGYAATTIENKKKKLNKNIYLYFSIIKADWIDY